MFFSCFWNFGQSFGSKWSSFSLRVLYLLCWLVVSALCEIGLNYFLFFLVRFARTSVIRVILSAIHTSNFLQAIFIYMVCFFLTAFGTCVSFSYILPCGVIIFGIWSTSRGPGRTFWPSLHNSRSSTPLECGVSWI